MGRQRCRRVLSAVALALTVFLLENTWAPANSLAASTQQSATSKPHKHAKAKVPAPEIALTPTLTAVPGATVTMPPVGLSMEYSVMAQDLASGACPPPALATELLQLGSPPLQLAGASQDMTAPSGAVAGSPTSWETATLYSLPATFWSQLHCLLATTKDPLTVGLNLKTGNLSWATQMATEAQGAAINGLSFSLGNEPDLYDLPNYSALAQPMVGEEAAAAGLYISLASYLRPAIGAAPLVGPELARPGDWRNQLPHVIEQLHDQTVGIHMYPLSACGSPRAVTIAGLLSAEAASDPTRFGWVVADARAAGAQAIISEANSASCGGLAGVSDSPAAAVWAVRFVLAALKTGFGEVRFHFSGDSYDPFVLRGTEVVKRPLDSALVALNQWLPVGSSLRTVAGVKGLIATAVGEPDGAVLLILDNERTEPRPVVLASAQSVDTAMLSPALAGLQSATLSPTGGRLRLSVPANSVLAVSVAP
jgi:hypothetical protein